MAGTKVSASYAATSVAEQQAAYDTWAGKYEQDLCAMGYRIPAVIAAVFTRFVPKDTRPILDAGCGAGIQAEPLAMIGYQPITGIDLSEGMLEVARGKGIYTDLRQMTLGEQLDFPDNTFGAVLSSGTITPKHAPAHSFKELIRVSVLVHRSCSACGTIRRRNLSTRQCSNSWSARAPGHRYFAPRVSSPCRMASLM